MFVYRKSEDTFRVSSESLRRKYYRVKNLAPGIWNCTCPCFQFRPVEDCKHIRRCQEALSQVDYQSDELSKIQQQILDLHCELGRLSDRVHQIEAEGLFMGMKNHIEYLTDKVDDVLSEQELINLMEERGSLWELHWRVRAG